MMEIPALISEAVVLRYSAKKDVLKNFAEFTGNYPQKSLSLQASVCNFIKKETLAQIFSYEFCEISKNTYFTEHLWATASSCWQKYVQN